MLRASHSRFQIEFVFAALAFGLFGGFAIAAHLSFVIGFGFPVGPAFLTFIQAHGHLQLVGWVGLFVIGVSLYFIPRLTSVPIERKRTSLVRRLIVYGLLFRSIGHTVLPYLVETRFSRIVGYITAVAGSIEVVGILAYCGLLAGVLGSARSRPSLRAVQPYFGIMVVGWILYGAINMALVIAMALGHESVLNVEWNEFANEVYIGLVLIPVAFALSLRTLPLYLTLPAATWQVGRLAYVYLCAFLFQWVPWFFASPLSLELSSLGMMLRALTIMWFVWRLDVLFHVQPPWTEKRKLEPAADRRPTRPGLPDYGEFGRFERLIRIAFVWLSAAALLDLSRGMAHLLGAGPFISADAVRHLVLLGFVTHLIFGMSVRMIPGFIERRKVWSARMVEATFWLGTAAVLGRVGPLLVPAAFFEALPFGVDAAGTAFALSGIFGMAAVFCLSINLVCTDREGRKRC